jgi:hypothetical protein
MMHKARAIILTTLSQSQEAKAMVAELEGQSIGPEAGSAKPTHWTRRFGASGRHRCSGVHAAYPS